MTKQATLKQIEYVSGLVKQAEGLGLNLFEEMTPLLWERMWDLEAGYDSEGGLIKPVSVQEASNVITELKGLIGQAQRAKQTKPVTAPSGELPPGLYKHWNGEVFEIYRVKKNRETGRSYACLMRGIQGKRLTEGGEIVAFDWIYEPGLIRKVGLKKEEFMELDDVAKLGLVFGACMVCGHGLKDAYSVQHGIGPVCAKKYGGAND